MHNLIRRDFTQVPNELINDAEISRDARFLFVYLCSKPDNWKFYSNTVCKDLGCSDDSRRKYMKELHEKGWISLVQEKKGDGTWGPNSITLNPYPVLTVSEKTRTGENTEPEKNGIGEITKHSNTDLFNNTDLKQKKEKPLSLFQSDDVASLPIQVLSYLNEKKAGKRGFEFTDANQSDIKARIREKKYTLDNFKKVIDYKVHEWSKDQKTRRWIRPETLFGTKFNGYLITAEESKDYLIETGSNNFVDASSDESDML